MKDNDNRLEGKREISQDPESLVREAWQRTHVMGGNDVEPSIFLGILEKLRSGGCTLEEAIREAEQTVSRKIER